MEQPVVYQSAKEMGAGLSKALTEAKLVHGTGELNLMMADFVPR